MIHHHRHPPYTWLIYNRRDSSICDMARAQVTWFVHLWMAHPHTQVSSSPAASTPYAPGSGTSKLDLILAKRRLDKIASVTETSKTEWDTCLRSTSSHSPGCLQETHEYLCAKMNTRTNRCWRTLSRNWAWNPWFRFGLCIFVWICAWCIQERRSQSSRPDVRLPTTNLNLHELILTPYRNLEFSWICKNRSLINNTVSRENSGGNWILWWMGSEGKLLVRTIDKLDGARTRADDQMMLAW